MRVPVAPYPFQKLLLSVILISAILKCVRWPPHCVDLTFNSVIQIIMNFSHAYWLLGYSFGTGNNICLFNPF